MYSRELHENVMMWCVCVCVWCVSLLGRRSEAQGDVNQARSAWMLLSAAFALRELDQSHPIMRACYSRWEDITMRLVQELQQEERLVRLVVAGTSMTDTTGQRSSGSLHIAHKDHHLLQRVEGLG